MEVKRALALPLAVVGGFLAIPSILMLFFGALALRLLPWFPLFEDVVGWGVVLVFSAFLGAALLKQAELLKQGSENKLATLPGASSSSEIDTYPQPQTAASPQVVVVRSFSR